MSILFGFKKLSLLSVKKAIISLKLYISSCEYAYLSLMGSN